MSRYGPPEQYGPESSQEGGSAPGSPAPYRPDPYRPDPYRQGGYPPPGQEHGGPGPERYGPDPHGPGGYGGPGRYGASEPYGARDPYGATDPYGARDPYGTPEPHDVRDPYGHPPHGQYPPARPGPDYPSPGVGGSPEETWDDSVRVTAAADDDEDEAGPPESPRRPLLLYGAVAVLAVLAAAGVGYALFLLTSGDSDPVAVEPTAPLVTGSPTASPAGEDEEAVGEEGTDGDTTGMNAAMARVEDCLVNDGTPDNPQMRIVACDDEDEAEAGQLFEVLAVVEEEIEGEGSAANEQAQEACAATDDYTHHYYEVADEASFVLCMAERE